jgi:Zn-finger domain-containing protein
MTDRDHFAAAATDDQSDWLRHAIASDKITIAELEAEIERKSRSLSTRHWND